MNVFTLKLRSMGTFAFLVVTRNTPLPLKVANGLLILFLGPSILLKPSVFVHSPSPEVTPITENSPTENEKDVMVSTQAAHHDSRGQI